MHAGHYISGAGHLALLGWLVLGGVFDSKPLPLQTTEVAVISGEAFEALMAAHEPPQALSAIAQPASPEVTPDAPELTVSSDQPTDIVLPPPSEAPTADQSPDVSALAPPPRAEVSDTVVVLQPPEPEIVVDVPQVAEQPVPQAAERVAPEPVAPPAPDAAPDPVVQEAVQVEQGDEVSQPIEETQEATAPEAAATEIVTEAEEPAAAINPPRPPLRPAPPQRPEPPEQPSDVDEVASQPDPAPVTEPSPQTPEAPTETRDAVAEALAQALASSATQTVPSGPPLTSGEKEDLRVAVSACWNVGSLSTEALRTTVTVAVAMAQDGKPVISSIRMLGSNGGSEAAARQAFEAARRAIIRCGVRGYQLPVEKYGQWQDIEMTFNPERMRVK